MIKPLCEDERSVLYITFWFAHASSRAMLWSWEPSETPPHFEMTASSFNELGGLLKFVYYPFASNNLGLTNHNPSLQTFYLSLALAQGKQENVFEQGLIRCLLTEDKAEPRWESKVVHGEFVQPTSDWWKGASETLKLNLSQWHRWMQSTIKHKIQAKQCTTTMPFIKEITE